VLYCGDRGGWAHMQSPVQALDRQRRDTRQQHGKLGTIKPGFTISLPAVCQLQPGAAATFPAHGGRAGNGHSTHTLCQPLSVYIYMYMLRAPIQLQLEILRWFFTLTCCCTLGIVTYLMHL